MNKYKVSIFMLTYNQESFIAQTIESIMMQKTNFDYQLVIGEDCSTDATLEICEKYAQQHPAKIKLLPSLENNIGLIANYMRTIKECDGKYIAICDGDDYWVDEYKLQKQVDFLENNPEFSIVGTNLYRLYSDGRMVEVKKQHDKYAYEFDDLIFRNLLPSVTALFRNISKEESFPEWIMNFPYGDWQTYLWIIRKGGKIHFLDDVTAVYRMDIGISSKLRLKHSRIIIVNIKILESILLDSNFSHKKDIVQKSIVKAKIGLMTAYNREKEYSKSIKLLLQNLKLADRKNEIIKLYFYSFKKSIKSIIVKKS